MSLSATGNHALLRAFSISFAPWREMYFASLAVHAKAQNNTEGAKKHYFGFQ